MSPVFLVHYVDGCVCVRHLPEEVMGPGCTIGRCQAGGENVILDIVLLGNLGYGHSSVC